MAAVSNIAGPLHPVGSWDADSGIINFGFILTVRF